LRVKYEISYLDGTIVIDNYHYQKQKGRQEKAYRTSNLLIANVSGNFEEFWTNSPLEHDIRQLILMFCGAKVLKNTTSVK